MFQSNTEISGLPPFSDYMQRLWGTQLGRISRLVRRQIRLVRSTVSTRGLIVGYGQASEVREECLARCARSDRPGNRFQGRREKLCSYSCF